MKAKKVEKQYQRRLQVYEATMRRVKKQDAFTRPGSRNSKKVGR